jgi:hypothetical protein
MIAGAVTLVCASRSDVSLRFFNFATRGNYSLPLELPSGPRGSGDFGDDAPITGASSTLIGISALTYHAASRTLAVGMTNGWIQCFHHVHESTYGPRLDVYYRPACFAGVARPLGQRLPGRFCHGLHTLTLCMLCRQEDDSGPGVEQSTAARDWLPLAPLQTASPVSDLALGPTNNTFAALAATSVTICQASALCAAAAPPLVAVQTALQRVAVYSVGAASGSAAMLPEPVGPASSSRTGRLGNAVGASAATSQPPRRARTLKMLGLALSEQLLAVWDTATVEVWVLHAADLTRASAFPNSSPPRGIAVHGATVWRARGIAVEGLGEDGRAAAALPALPPGAGAPEVLAVGGDTLAVLTASLALRMYSVKGRKPSEISGTQVRDHHAATLAACATRATYVRCCCDWSHQRPLIHFGP